MTALAHIADAAWALRYVLAFLAAGTWFALALCRAADAMDRAACRDSGVHPCNRPTLPDADDLGRWSA